MPRYKRPRAQQRKLLTDINVVPYIDVMLVLLVIFMITAPLFNRGIAVHLPQTKGQHLTSEKLPLIVSIDANGRYYLNQGKHPDQAMNAQKFMMSLNQLIHTKDKVQPMIYVRGDRFVTYGKVMHAMALMKKVGAQHLALVTELSPSTKRH